MMTAGIVGGGIAGRLLAFSLYKTGWQITLFAEDDKNNCSEIAAGLLTPVAEAAKNHAVIFELGLEALQYHWPNILNQLPEEIFFKQLGTLVLSHSRDYGQLEHFIRRISHKLKLAENFYCKKIHKEDILSLEPQINRFDEGYHLLSEGQIDNQHLMQVLKNCLKNKIHHIQRWVTEIKPHKIKVANQIYSFDMVFDCRGLESKSFYADLRGVRGELIWLHAPHVNIQRPIHYLHPRYPLYIVPRLQHCYIIGASEVETESQDPITVRTTLELLTACYDLQPNFAEATIIKTATQCRPTLSSHLPKIKYMDGLLSINGLYRYGFLILPTLMNDILRWLSQGLSATCFPQLFESMENVQ